MQDADLDRSITVICLTIQRRWASEWQKAIWSPYPVDLIIADGSEGLASAATAGEAGDCRWLQLDMPGTSYLERLRAAAGASRTRHAIIIDDEEAYLFQGLLRASRELDLDATASCAGGSAAYVRRVDREVRLRPFAGRIADWSVPFSLTDPEPAARVEKVLSTFRTSNLYYSLVRTSFLVELVAQVPVAQIEGTLFGMEFLWVAALAASGTYSMGNYPFWLRMGGSQPGRNAALATLEDSQIDAIASRVWDFASFTPPTSGDREGLRNALRVGIRKWEHQVFGPGRPTPEEARQRSRDERYLESFVTADKYLRSFGFSESSWSEDLHHVLAVANSPLRPPESLSDAMA